MPTWHDFIQSNRRSQADSTCYRNRAANGRGSDEVVPTVHLTRTDRSTGQLLAKYGSLAGPDWRTFPLRSREDTSTRRNSQVRAPIRSTGIR